MKRHGVLALNIKQRCLSGYANSGGCNVGLGNCNFHLFESVTMGSGGGLSCKVFSLSPWFLPSRSIGQVGLQLCSELNINLGRFTANELVVLNCWLLEIIFEFKNESWAGPKVGGTWDPHSGAREVGSYEIFEKSTGGCLRLSSGGAATFLGLQRRHLMWIHSSGMTPTSSLAWGYEWIKNVHLNIRLIRAKKSCNSDEGDL